MLYVNPFRKRSRWTALPLLAALLFAIRLSAQPVLVKDINARTDRGGSSMPAQLCNVNGTLFFVGNDGATGPELWKSDGTAAGTILVKDIYPGKSGFGPLTLTNVNGTLFFSADDGANGRELWKSNGTAAGTVMVRDARPGSLGSHPHELKNVNGTLFFSADDGTSGGELWKSNGTAAGTVMVKNIRPETGFPINSSYPLNLTDVNGVLYFVARNDLNEYDLWKSNGTTAGTVRVKSLGPNAGSEYSRQLTNVNGTLYFLLDDGDSGAALWRSNGTDAGTFPVRTFPDRYNTSGLTNVNGTLFFSAGDGINGPELWKSNGTAAGTVLVKDIRPGPSGSRTRAFTPFNNALYFTADDGVNGEELWKSDGTAGGTVLVKDIAPGTGSATSVTMTVAGGTLYFGAHNRTNGEELWKTDGTAAGTVMVKDINPGSAGATLQFLTAVNNTVYLNAYDGVEQELWKSDGTAAGTVRVKNIRPGSGSSGPQNLTNVNGTVYFAANDGNSGNELWKTNGTAAGTVRVADIATGPAGADPTWLTNVNGTLYFTATDGTAGAELWKSDGTTTTRVKDIRAGTRGSDPAWLTNVNGTLYFVATDSLNGEELWRSDGTAAGTVLVRDINPGPGGAQATLLTNVNGILYLVAGGGGSGKELWRSNGTAAGTTLVKDIAPGATDAFPFYGYHYPYNVPRLTHHNGTLYFAATDGTHGIELWRSDGTESGTTLVKDIRPGATGSFSYLYESHKVLSLNGTLYFAADDGVSGEELWRSDGTAAGTVRVTDGNPGPAPSSPAWLTNFNGTLFFTAQAAVNGHSGRKIWRSDGTASGTFVLADPGYPDYAYNLTVVGNALCFSAFKYNNYGMYGEVGGELWRSDGTAAGTLLVKDIQAGPDGSWPGHLVPVNGTLYFSADQGSTGAELWKYNPAACIPPAAALAVTGGTVCAGNPVGVQVKGSQTGVTYQLYFNNSPVGDPKAGGGDLSISLPGNLFVPGTYTLGVQAAGCVTVPLAQTATIQVLPPVAPPTAAGLAVNAGQTATLTASGAPAGGTYRWYGAASGGTMLATGATYTTPGLWANTTYYVSVYQVQGCESARVPVTVGINGGSQLRVNAGGGAFRTPEGKPFAADGSFAGGTVSAITGGEVANTTSDALYHNLRVGAGFNYALPTGNGDFDVTLHFNETWWGYRTAGGVGSRQFNVDLEGGRRLTNYDIFAAAGGAMRARTETFRVRVADGTLNIAFSKGLADNPAVAAIEAVPASPALRVNAGGAAYTTAGGQTYVADAYFTGGSVSALAAGEVANTTEDALYRTLRVGSSFSYNLPVSNATYGVLLHFNETWWGHRTAGGVGSRQFNVDMEGVRKLTNYDIFAAAGGAMRSRVEAFSVTVTDGTLNIAFSKGLADNPAVAAIEVVPAPGGRLAVAERGQTGATLYPNPVRDKLYVSLDGPAGGVQGIALTDALGVVRMVNGHRPTAAGFELDVTALRPGAYLLTVRLAGETRLLRFVKQ